MQCSYSKCLGQNSRNLSYWIQCQCNAKWMLDPGVKLFCLWKFEPGLVVNSWDAEARPSCAGWPVTGWGSPSPPSPDVWVTTLTMGQSPVSRSRVCSLLVTSGHLPNFSKLLTTKFHLRPKSEQEWPYIHFSKQEKKYVSYNSDMSKIVIFVALSSDLVSCFLWLVWVWAAKLCHVLLMCRGPGFCDKNTLRYISWHYKQNMTNATLLMSTWPTRL